MLLSSIAAALLLGCNAPGRFGGAATTPPNPVFQRTLVEIAAEGARGTVFIRRGNFTGSGAYVGRGRVLTAAHVVVGTGTLSMTFDDHPTGLVRIIAADLERDLALLQVESLDSLGPQELFLGNSDDLLPGEELLAVGYPKGVGLTWTRGIVSGLKRSIVTNLLQTDAALNPGNSGGPVLNRFAQIVGIADFNFPGFPGLNFAIASSTVQAFLTAVSVAPLPVARVDVGSSGLPPLTAATIRETQRYYNDGTGEDVIEGFVENSSRGFTLTNIEVVYAARTNLPGPRNFVVRVDATPPGERRVWRLRVPKGYSEVLRSEDLKWTVTWAPPNAAPVR